MEPHSRSHSHSPAPSSSTRRGTAAGLLAAVLFGASAPLAKLLVPSFGALWLAAALYAGAAIALGLARVGLRLARVPRREAAVRRADAPLLAAVVVLGGVLGPVLLLAGLARLSGVAGALLLSAEGPLTALVATLVFGEHLPRRARLSALLVFAGAALLAALGGRGAGAEVAAAALATGARGGAWTGVALVVGACLAWAIENNLSQRLSIRDPLATVQVKTAGGALGAGAIALAAGAQAPAVGPALASALALGAASYGLSIVLDMYALRALGAAREAVVFATAPFAGALLGLVVLDAPAGWPEATAGALMLAGVLALRAEDHSHRHVHEPVEHEHAHVHDQHHRHAHPPGAEAAAASGEPHTHVHRHDALAHEHPHVSDVHHRHRH